MNPGTGREAARLAGLVGRGLKKTVRVDVVLSPPFIFIPLLSAVRRKIPVFKIGAQDVFYENSPGGVGPYTGEISAKQLKACGAELIIVGHSERRALGETDETVNKKLKTVLRHGMRAVLCVGEREKKKDEAFPQIVRDELRFGLRKIKKSLFKNLVVAYEPIWAIGTGKTDTPKNVYEMSLMIRRELYRLLGRKIALKIPILYGGSVDGKNSSSFLSVGGADGLLVGGASLNPKKFLKIIKEASKL